MFGPLGFPEMLFIVAVALLIFGPKRLPELGRTLGRGLSEFRKASNELKRTINTELALEEETAASRRPAEAPASWPTRPAAAIPAADPEIHAADPEIHGEVPPPESGEAPLDPIYPVADLRAEPRSFRRPAPADTAGEP